MEKVKYPQEKVHNTQVKGKKNLKKKSKKLSRVYCVLCRSSYLNKDGQDHMHSVRHHRELQAVMGRPSCHNCQACNESSMGLNEYEKHISTAQHKAKLSILKSRNVKPICLIKTLGTELMTQVLKRNKTLKMSEKKILRKKKKKEKQLAGQGRAERARQATRKMTAVPKGVKPVISKQVNKRILKQVKGTEKEASQKAVLQNEENKAACRGSAAQTWQQTPAREQFSQSSYRVVPSDNFQASGFSHCSRVDSYKMDTSFKRFLNTHGFARTLPENISWPAIIKHNHKYHNHDTQYNSAADFTSDELPPHRSVIFDYSQNQNTESNHPRCESLAQPASASKPADTAPIRDVDVGSVLWQIRRALGVREPCRAEREARRQSSGAGAGAQNEQSTGGYAKEAAPGISSAATTPAQSSTGRSLVSVSNSGVHPFVAKPKRTTVTSVDKPSQPCDKSLVAASNTDQALDSNNLVGQSSTPATFPESNPNISHKVRIAHQPSKDWKGKDETSLGSSAEARKNLSWSRKKELENGLNRFGMKPGNPDQDTSVQVEDMPLSEGFHWESVPHRPSDTHCTKLPPQPPDTTWTQPQADTQTDSQTQRLPEQSGAVQDAGNKQVSNGVSVKVEVIQDDENEDVAENNRVGKKKHKVVTLDDESEGETKRRKKKGKSNKDQNQMDQLLAVSLREEELSQSLQDLDKSLIQARSALQAAYTEVQRLLLVRQQCTAEVNSLRAMRIEILQGMQGVYSGESKAVERATPSPAGAAVSAVQPRLSPLPSSSAFPASASPHLPHPLQTSSINPLSLPSVPVKQEPCTAPAVSTRFETPQVPVNQPVSLFPPDLLPPLLLTLPNLAAPTTPTTSVSSVKKLKSEDPISASPPVSVQQQEQVTREEPVKTVSAVVEEDDSDSEGENIRPAVEKPVSTVVPERNQNAAPTDDDESDDSVQMVGPSNQEVIAIDDSDTEETVSIIPQEPPPESDSVELSSVSTQTRQQIDAERKPEPKYVPKKEEAVPHECADVAECEEPSTGAFENHHGPVHSLQVHEGLLYTCSGDNTARAYSLINRECLAVFKGHTNKINCLLVSASHLNMPARLFTGSSDQTIRCYSIKSKKCLNQISLSDRVLCLHTAWNILYAGLASGSVASYDFKTLKELDVFECHGPRGVSCLGTAQEGARRVLLVGSYDSTISVRDAKSGLLLRSLEGHTKTVLCMKVVNDLVFSGSSDTSVHAHNIHTGELIRIYKGHGHAVTSIVILGKVMVTACLDKLVRVYELQSHDRLQVYGGHSDMVMCMAVHKSVIYTGCYDGSVQAVKLNLMKNYRCWWQNCSLIFGMKDHLLQHLIRDHTNPSLEAVRCRWKGCTTFFARQQAVKQELPEHMRSHVEKESEVQL